MSRARRLMWAGAAVALAVALVMVFGVATVATRAHGGLSAAWQAWQERHPTELVRYARVRLEGHPNLERVVLPVLRRVDAYYIREPSSAPPNLGKGVRNPGLAPQQFTASGRPLAALPAPAMVVQPANRTLFSTEALAEALRDAAPGEVLELAPGTYRIGLRLNTGRAGSPDKPITLRAVQAGSVTLLVDTVQAVVVSQPYWVFENLVWRGVCKRDADCEHAVHVVGAANGTVLRNNRFEDFNAAIKINGENGIWPDAGLLQFNTFSNGRARRTDKPVTQVDLVGASHWQVLDNYFERFVKGGGNRISFGVFMKGGGEGGRIERNLVVCTPEGVAQRGQRVGISLGGGGTDAGSCRRRPCDAEHRGGIVANNVVAHCNDAGIDIHRSPKSTVAHNTLINTLGVSVREAPAEARLQANLNESGVHPRRGGRFESLDDATSSDVERLLTQPDALDLHWRELPRLVARPDLVLTDFCARPRGPASPPGATQAADCNTTR